MENENEDKSDKEKNQPENEDEDEIALLEKGSNLRNSGKDYNDDMSFMKKNSNEKIVNYDNLSDLVRETMNEEDNDI